MHDFIDSELEKKAEMQMRCIKILHSIELMGVDTRKNEMYQAIYYIMGFTDEIRLCSSDRQSSEAVS